MDGLVEEALAFQFGLLALCFSIWYKCSLLVVPGALKSEKSAHSMDIFLF